MTEEDNELIGQANIIWEIKMAFHPGEFTDKPAEYDKRIRHDYRLAHQVYKKHKCPSPKKNKTDDDSCYVCYAFIEWIGFLYELNYNHHAIEVLPKIEEDFFDYGGKLPFCLHNPEWKKVRLGLFGLQYTFGENLNQN